MICPRCKSTEFTEIDCGSDGYDDDITYTSEVCEKCELFHDGWTDKWLIDCDNWMEAEDCEEFITQRKTNA